MPCAASMPAGSPRRSSRRPSGRTTLTTPDAALAGDRNVALSAGSLTGQAIAAVLVDELPVALAVVLGSGVRFFGDYAAATVLLDDPWVVQGDRNPPPLPCPETLTPRARGVSRRAR
jgi:hypothetical protein